MTGTVSKGVRVSRSGVRVSHNRGGQDTVSRDRDSQEPVSRDRPGQSGVSQSWPGQSVVSRYDWAVAGQ